MRPAHAVGVRELADELDRWSAYAQGAVDDGRVAQRRVTEQVRRAERSGGLAHDILESSAAQLAEMRSLYERLAAELTIERAAHHHESDRLAAELRRYEVLGRRVDTTLAANLREQERLAARVTALTNRLTTSQAELAELRERASGGKIHRPGRRRALLAELARGEAARLQISDQCDEARMARHELRARHRALSQAAQRAAEELAPSQLASERLAGAADHLARAMDLVERGDRALADAERRHADATTQGQQLVADLSVARASLEAAAALQHRWEMVYEATQRLAVDTVEELRDRIVGYGDVTREIEHIVLGLTPPAGGR